MIVLLFLLFYFNIYVNFNDGIAKKHQIFLTLGAAFETFEDKEVFIFVNCVRVIMTITPELTDELIQKICECIKLGNTHESACNIVGIPFKEFTKWLKAGEAGKEPKYIELYNRVKSTKWEFKDERKSDGYQQKVIIKSWPFKKEEIEKYCKYLGKDQSELSYNETELMISELKLRRYLPKE